MKKLILILALMFCLIFSFNTLAFEKVDVTMVNCGASTVYVPKIQTLLDHGLGSSTLAVPLLANDPALTVYATSSAITGTVRSTVFNLTMGANGAAIVEGLYVIVNTEFYAGEWVNAIVGRVDFGAAGDQRFGMAAAICAEINLPAKAFPGGNYYAFDAEIEVPTGAVMIDSAAFPTAFLKMGLWGDAKTEFDNHGYVFHLDGCASSTGNLLYTHVVTTPGAAAGSLKINIGGASYFLYFWGAEGTT